MIKNYLVSNILQEEIMAYPEWVEKYRKSGTNISCIHLKYIQYLKINNSWVPSEISGKTQKLLDKLQIHIT